MSSFKASFSTNGYFFICFIPKGIILNGIKKWINPIAFNVFSFPKVESGPEAPTLRGGVESYLGFAYLNRGTPDSMLEASKFIHTIEKRQGIKIACLEEIAFDKKYISSKQLLELSTPLSKNEYGEYLMKIVDKKKQ